MKDRDTISIILIALIGFFIAMIVVARDHDDCTDARSLEWRVRCQMLRQER